MAIETRMFTCARCKHEMVFEVPKTEILNGRDVSLIILSHPKPDVCGNCGQTYLFALNKGAPVNVQFGWVPVAVKEDVKEESGVIMPPANVDIKKMLRN